jgi:hypothetical protein
MNILAELVSAPMLGRLMNLFARSVRGGTQQNIVVSVHIAVRTSDFICRYTFRAEERGGSKRLLLSYAFRVVHMKFPAGVWVLC